MDPDRPARSDPRPGSDPAHASTVGDADYRLMVQGIADYAIVLLGPDGAILSWNEGARRMKGYEAGEVIGRHFGFIYPQDLLERRWPENALDTARREGRFEDEVWQLRKDGTRFWASIVFTRLLTPGGELRGFSKITRDLTERRRQEDLLRLSEERFRLLVEGVQDYAIFMLDPGGHIVSWNLGAQKNKGYTAAEIIGKHFSVFYPPEVAASGWPDRELELAIRDGRMEDEGWRIRKDGSRFWASVIITSLTDSTGRHRGFAKVTRDLTERRRIHALEDEGRRLATFLAMLGHELRNPLAPISNAVAILERGQIDSPALRSSRDIIGRQLKQLNRLVDDLLDVGRITSGKIHLDLKPVRVRQALEEAAEAAGPLVEKNAHELILDHAGGCDPWVRGDFARIVQILSNLLNNAAKFTPPGGRIQARVSVAKGHAEIAVRDNGPGIPERDQQRVFDLFVQGEQDAARSLGGLGLGLSLVQQLVSLHGGQVSMFSRGLPREGAEFVISLPVIDPPAEAPARAVREGAAPGKRVLVVDDNRDGANTMATLVEALGYRAAQAHDGPSAVDAIQRDAPDLVLLDIGLPGMSGLEVARKVRADIAYPPPLIAVTGYGQAQDRAATAQAGFHAHLIKPVDIDELLGHLQSLLGSPGDPAG